MEIERKWLLPEAPEWASLYPGTDIVQGYISTDPTIRVRRDGESFVLTIKGRGLLAREEYELDIDEEAFRRLLKKCDGRLIEKRRCRIPVDVRGTRLAPGMNGAYTAELDIFRGEYDGLVYLEVEFESTASAEVFSAPAWFGREVTGLGGYSNGDLAMGRQAPVIRGYTGD